MQRRLGQPTSPAFAEQMACISGDQVGMQDSLRATFGSPDRADRRRALQDKAPQGERLVVRRPHFGQEPRRIELSVDFRVYLVGLHPGMSDCLYPKRVGRYLSGLAASSRLMEGAI